MFSRLMQLRTAFAANSLTTELGIMGFYLAVMGLCGLLEHPWVATVVILVVCLVRLGLMRRQHSPGSRKPLYTTRPWNRIKVPFFGTLRWNALSPLSQDILRTVVEYEKGEMPPFELLRDMADHVECSTLPSGEVVPEKQALAVRHAMVAAGGPGFIRITNSHSYEPPGPSFELLDVDGRSTW